MKVKIPSQTFYKVKITSNKEIFTRELLRKNLHKLLDRWIDKPGFHEIGDNMSFEVVNDDEVSFKVELSKET